MTQAAWGAPGGKHFIAEKIADRIPEHSIYVEPFAGGAAVYFKKPSSEVEVLNDKDTDIARAFQFLRSMTPEQFKQLKKMNWKVNAGTFKRLKDSQPISDIDRFRKFYYLRKGSFGSGGETVNPMMEGETIDVNKLWKVHDRLKNTKIMGRHALELIRKYDSPDTFFYLDPPYPDRDFIGAKETFTEDDLTKLVSELKGIKGKFLLSLNKEWAKSMPSEWDTSRIFTRRNLRPDEYEMLSGNYPHSAKSKKVYQSDTSWADNDIKSYLNQQRAQRRSSRQRIRKPHFRRSVLPSIQGLRG